VNGYVTAELAEREASRRSSLTQEQWRGRVYPYVRRIVESGRYPMFTRLVMEAEDFPDPDVVFERRLGYVLDGLPANKALRRPALTRLGEMADRGDFNEYLDDKSSYRKGVARD
jgi:hypothetical protein